ncbi:hypothetical protein B9Q01_03100 [Candidatus Marsarchaeota G1 archaeon OSP_D]|uniref:Uncharacterized protein n=2 Tax=Candidatus Marsarchaeota group 1 TaxID=2203770 RepID=A0A2R6ABX0_9ARCH|nr:MAG: hypothetical protein B9Q01_03100 [Candidatus Marsarchaeota G1 archaeon OSP_D]PSN89435.1 MAG: hypothetical protein B9Q00_01245 [Candidatus Marsarchaeota G1 archaeon OSP_C]
MFLSYSSFSACKLYNTYTQPLIFNSRLFLKCSEAVSPYTHTSIFSACIYTFGIPTRRCFGKFIQRTANLAFEERGIG